MYGNSGKSRLGTGLLVQLETVLNFASVLLFVKIMYV